MTMTITTTIASFISRHKLSLRLSFLLLKESILIIFLPKYLCSFFIYSSHDGTCLFFTLSFPVQCRIFNKQHIYWSDHRLLDFSFHLGLCFSITYNPSKLFPFTVISFKPFSLFDERYLNSFVSVNSTCKHTSLHSFFIHTYLFNFDMLSSFFSKVLFSVF